MWDECDHRLAFSVTCTKHVLNVFQEPSSGVLHVVKGPYMHKWGSPSDPLRLSCKLSMHIQKHEVTLSRQLSNRLHRAHV